MAEAKVIRHRFIRRRNEAKEWMCKVGPNNKVDFAPIDKKTLKDPRLSPQMRNVYIYHLLNEDNFKATFTDMKLQTGYGARTIQIAHDGLIFYGLLTEEKIWIGKINYKIYHLESPLYFHSTKSTYVPTEYVRKKDTGRPKGKHAVQVSEEKSEPPLQVSEEKSEPPLQVSEEKSEPPFRFPDRNVKPLQVSEEKSDSLNSSTITEPSDVHISLVLREEERIKKSSEEEKNERIEDTPHQEYIMADPADTSIDDLYQASAAEFSKRLKKDFGIIAQVPLLKYCLSLIAQNYQRDLEWVSEKYEEWGLYIGGQKNPNVDPSNTLLNWVKHYREPKVLKSKRVKTPKEDEAPIAEGEFSEEEAKRIFLRGFDD